jgi:hypothetical protein
MKTDSPLRSTVMIPTPWWGAWELEPAQQSVVMASRVAAKGSGVSAPPLVAARRVRLKRFPAARVASRVRFAPVTAGKTQARVLAKASAPWVHQKRAHARTDPHKFECAVFRATGASGRTAPLSLNARRVRSIAKAGHVAAAVEWRNEPEPA